MKILSSLRRRTKSGISVWHFCHVAETGQYFAVGGDDLKTILADDVMHLRQVFNNFKRYGYRTELPTKKQFINDPWASEMPASMQMQLEALA